MLVDEKGHLTTDVSVDRDVDGVQAFGWNDETTQICGKCVTVAQAWDVIDRTRDIPIYCKDAKTIAVFIDQLARDDGRLSEIGAVRRDHQATICFERPGKRAIR